MPDTNQDVLTLLIAGAAFMLIISVWLIAVISWSTARAKRNRLMRARLDAQGASISAGGDRVLRLWHDGKEATTLVPGLRPQGAWVRFEKFLTDANVEMPASTALAALFGVSVFAAAVAYVLTGSVFVPFVAPIGVLIIIWLILTQRIAKRLARFEGQLIDALELAARSLRVGHPLIGSFRLVAEEVPAPLGEVFGEVCQQQALGVSMDTALRSVTNETHSQDLKLFATSVVIQLRSGGNLANMMQRLAAVVRERSRLARRVRVMTSQTQFSKRVLLTLPFLIFVGMNVINPAYMRTLYTTFTGQIILGTASVGLFMGWVTMNWISRLNT